MKGELDMAFDACMMRAVLSEFSSEFPEAKIEKVLQPRVDEIDMLIHYGKSSRRLVFNVGPNAPRLQLSDIAPDYICLIHSRPFKIPLLINHSKLVFVLQKVLHLIHHYIENDVKQNKYNRQNERQNFGFGRRILQSYLHQRAKSKCGS